MTVWDVDSSSGCFPSQHLVPALVDVVQGAGLELEQLLLQQARDLHLGLLDGQLLGALNGQKQLPVSLRHRLTRPVICPCRRKDNLMTDVCNIVTSMWNEVEWLIIPNTDL